MTTERNLRISGVLLILGLLVEAVSLFWVHPVAFLSFICLGGVLLAAGILIYLYSLVSPASLSTSETKRT